MDDNDLNGFQEIQTEDLEKVLEMGRRKKIPVPEEMFEEFYKRFSTVEEMVQDPEWVNIYSNYYEVDEYEMEIKMESTQVVESYDSIRQREEYVKCALSFTYFAHKYGRITHPVHGLIPAIAYIYQRRVIDQYGKNRFNIISKFRQGGLTTFSVLWALWRCMFRKGQQILVMSKTDREAIVAGEVAKIALENLPSWLKPTTDKENEHEKRFTTTNSKLMFHTPAAARGKAITILIIDEAAFIPDMEKHWKAMYPVISTGGSCIVVSTVNGLGNWYQKAYYDAKSKKNKFNIIDLDYWWHPAYNNPAWVRDQKAQLGEKGWLQEVLRSFLGSGETYISFNIITELDEDVRSRNPTLRQAFAKWTNKEERISDEWRNGALWFFKEPVDGHDYIIGVDCAEGIGDDGDNSCFEVIDMKTMEQVAQFYSNSVPPSVFAQILNEIGLYYNIAMIAIENMSVGGAVISSLEHNLSYENLYQEGKKNQSPGLKVGKNNRMLLLETLQHKLINRAVKINSTRFVDELKTFNFNAEKKRPEAVKGKHDDSIMALSIALYVCELQNREIPVGAVNAEEVNQVFKTKLYEEIKREILEGKDDPWTDELDYNYSEQETSLMRSEEELPSAAYHFRRKYEKLLREFGW